MFLMVSLKNLLYQKANSNIAIIKEKDTQKKVIKNFKINIKMSIIIIF